MKNVLLLGDSIRLGYCPHVKESLKEVANVYYPEENCRCTQYTLISLSNWMKLVNNPEKIDVIHWNNGHWDIAHWRGEEISLNTPEQYGIMLERIYKQLIKCFPNAKIIFATTTPMNPNGSIGLNPRTTNEIIEYNEIARGVMKKLGVSVNDLFEFMLDKDSTFYADYCHYTEEGFKILGCKVSQVIKNILE